MSTVRFGSQDAKGGVRRTGPPAPARNGQGGENPQGERLDDSPFDPEAEKGIVGAMLLMPELSDDARRYVGEADFFDRINGILFREICNLYDAGKSVDPVVLSNACKKLRGVEADLWQAAGPAYLVEIGKAVPRLENVVLYSQQVRSASVRRRMLLAASAMLSDARDFSIDAEELTARAEQLIHAVEDTTAISSNTATPIGVAAAESIRQLQARIDGTAVQGVPTGFTNLDEASGGLMPQRLIIVAARPGVGKSALAQALAVHAAVDRKKHVAFFSLEMSRDELATRMLSSMSWLPAQGFWNGRMNPHQLACAIDASNRLAQAPLVIVDDAIQRVADIARVCRQMKRRGGLDLVVIDYLQLIQPANTKDPRQEQVAKISRSLKLLARSLDVPVVCLAQLNRETDKQNSPPKLSHLRESGAIEQDADTVLFIHKNAPEGKNAPEYGAECEVELWLAKQRNGRCGKFPVEWHPSYVTFKDKPEERFVAGTNDDLASWNVADEKDGDRF